MKKATLSRPLSGATKTEVINVGLLLKVPASEKECATLEELAETLMAEAPNTPLLDTIANLISAYENTLNLGLNKPMTQAERLYNLMESANKNQVEMAEYFGGQSAVSAVLSGKRKISIAAAQKMSKAFDLNLDYFLAEK
jgi:antitoxin component HigA of HigAB toxin-antitoxin module